MSQRIVISGGTGFLGRRLAARFSREGHEVVVLTRSGRLPGDMAELTGVRAVRWDAVSGGEWERELDGAQAVIHLAGEQAVGVRYTEQVKQRIVDSRVKSGEALVRAIEKAKSRPEVMISSSGVGYYGGRLDAAPLDEGSPAGDDFLASVCVVWEGAVQPVEALGVRLVVARLGIVLGKGGGALETMARPFKWFVGGVIGSGKQMFTWIHVDDVVDVIARARTDASLRGPVNVAAPNAVDHTELAHALGRALHRPAIFPVPGFALRALFAEGAVPLLTGQNAVPKKLEGAGYRFQYTSIDAALAEAAS
jgi:uncharacterized protein (TIGR01777 family)